MFELKKVLYDLVINYFFFNLHDYSIEQLVFHEYTIYRT